MIVVELSNVILGFVVGCCGCVCAIGGWWIGRYDREGVGAKKVVMVSVGCGCCCCCWLPGFWGMYYMYFALESLGCRFMVVVNVFFIWAKMLRFEGVDNGWNWTNHLTSKGKACCATRCEASNGPSIIMTPHA